MSENDATYKSLTLERRDHVATVTLCGPGKGNAMGPEFWREMPPLFAALDRDDDVRAVIIRGSGVHFSYGLDLMRMLQDLGPAFGGTNLAKERTALYDTIGEMQLAVTNVARCRKPVIAAIAGWCIGGGLDLIAACDVRICSSDARFSLRETKLAIVADIGSLQRLPAIIGQGRTRELAFTGKDIDAGRAMQIGLVNDVFADHEALFAAASEMAHEIAANPPLAVQGAKRVLNWGQGRPLDDALDHVALWNSAFLQSNDLGEALAAFLERRPPRYSGS
ncbi:MAG: crotonase/enoyl-CoA hydratase family protein [Myxococcales bacterium]|nr:crotonase/enoyl-CoA hydratase family protein [Myxococcales bacterium]